MIDQICADFNNLRLHNQDKEFSRNEIHNLLIKNIPNFNKNTYILTILVKNKILIKKIDGKNVKYMFTKNPIYINVLNNAFNEMCTYNREQQKRFRSKHGNIQVDEEYCINFLKERGYKILKQFIDYKEI